MKDLRQVTVIGLGLLGGSVGLTILRCFSSVKVIGYAHRPQTRRKAKQISVATEFTGNLKSSVKGSDLVILATPIQTFERIFKDIADSLEPHSIVTDVGSTKVLPHLWAKKHLPKNVYYVGSHPIAGSEQRGVEYSRDDLFERADCIVTSAKDTNRKAVEKIIRFWKQMGCCVKTTNPSEHDSILANVSHLPHITAAGLLNCNKQNHLEYAGKGFIDTSRVASGPPNIWVDILMTNAANCSKGISKLQAELEKFKKAIEKGRRNKVEKLLETARNKRSELIKHKLKSKELI
ncbi:MAG: prephenate dehydrogenase/arogenate dehydrogenase family protein [Phycisphaerae bacterium]